MITTTVNSQCGWQSGGWGSDIWQRRHKRAARQTGAEHRGGGWSVEVGGSGGVSRIRGGVRGGISSTGTAESSCKVRFGRAGWLAMAQVQPWRKAEVAGSCRGDTKPPLVARHGSGHGRVVGTSGEALNRGAHSLHVQVEAGVGCIRNVHIVGDLRAAGAQGRGRRSAPTRRQGCMGPKRL